MGVRGLKRFIDDRFLIKDHRLQNAELVIDANNLAGVLLEKVKYQDRTDRVGLNLVAYGKQVELFFDNLKKCNIKPILIFDGAQTNDTNTSKISKRVSRNKEHIENVEMLARLEDIPIVHPACTGMILKSIAIEKKVKVEQCFYEADKYVAKMANVRNGFVLSEDTDFYILDVKRGVILTKSLDFEDVKEQNGEERSGEEVQPHFYMDCDLFDQSHFLEAFPGLDKSCLPLFASIAGSDISGDSLHFLLPDSRSKFDRLRILLEFFCNKSLEQSIDSLLARVAANKHENEALIRDCIRYYDLPEESSSDDFDKGISEHYGDAFNQKYCINSGVDVVEKEMRKLACWLRERIKKSNLSKNCLELALRNTCFLRPEMDDFTQPGSHHCINRYRSVMLTLMRSSHTDNQPCSLYGREGNSLKMFKLEPLLRLRNNKSIDYLIYDVCDDISDDIVKTKLKWEERTAILLATFHSSLVEFLDSVAQYEDFLEQQYREEFAVLKLLMRYVELEEHVTFPSYFRKSFLGTYLYYLHFGDSEVETNVLNGVDERCLGFLRYLKQLARVKYLEDFDQWNIADYDITIVRNIVQMQTAIRAYEELNAFLGTTLPTLRMHKWFNSCFIYNFAVLIGSENIWIPLFITNE